MNTTRTPPASSALSTALQPPPAAPSPGTSPAPHPVPALPPPHQALLADFDDPDLTTLDLARRHALTLDDLAAIAAAPAFARALALLRALAEVRRPLQIARAEARAAETLTALTAREPTSATAAKEVRLAVKDLLRLLGAGAFQAPDRPKGDALEAAGSLGAAGFQPVDRPRADALGGAAFQAASPPGAGASQAPDTPPSPAPAGEVSRRSRDGGGPPSPAPAGEVSRRSRDGGGLESPNPPPDSSEPPPPPLRSGTAPGSPGEATTPRTPPHKKKYPRGTKPRPKPVSR